MTWNPLIDAVDALNAIGAILTNLPNITIQGVMALVYCAVYPVIVGINLLAADLNTVYQPFALLINQFSVITEYPQQVFTLVIPLPSVWTTIIMIQILVSVSIRAYRWINEIRSWIPTWGGGM